MALELVNRYVGDRGQIIRIVTGLDLTNYDVLELHVTKPVFGAPTTQETLVWSGIIYLGGDTESGHVGTAVDGVYDIVVPNELDIEGNYSVQPKVGISGSTDSLISTDPLTLVISPFPPDLGLS
ncbi:MAG TPA: hypothetical protein ENI23_16030 [bacterium]|nr:hypothetical protein [bacterium]